jgi:hypothetical protein
MMHVDDTGFGAGVQKWVLKATAEGLTEATGTAELTLQSRLMREVLDALWIPYGLPEDEQSVQLDAAYALMREIAPRDAMEGLLTAQMAGVHGAAMDCLRRAMQPGQTDEVRDDALRLAVKLLALYPRQMEALDRRRGRGSHHRVTVEHVTVRADDTAPESQDEVEDARIDAAPAAGNKAVRVDRAKRPDAEAVQPRAEPRTTRPPAPLTGEQVEGQALRGDSRARAA